MIMSGHMGNGLVIWRKGNDETIAFISPYRVVKYYKEVTDDERAKIIQLVKEDDRCISVSQSDKVFRTPPQLH